MRIRSIASCLPRTRRRHYLLIVLAVAGTVLTACGDHVDPSKHGIVFSPNGKPLSGGTLGHPDCATALGNWYDAITQGKPLTSVMFMDDAKRQFVAMDIDHTGLLTPDELSRYRAAYFYKSDSPDEGKGRKKHHSDDNGDERGDRLGKYYDSSDDRADPVMSADRRNRNEVSYADFLTYARQNFAHLDKNRDSQLSREEILGSCPS